MNNKNTIFGKKENVTYLSFKCLLCKKWFDQYQEKSHLEFHIEQYLNKHKLTKLLVKKEEHLVDLRDAYYYVFNCYVSSNISQIKIILKKEINLRKKEISDIKVEIRKLKIEIKKNPNKYLIKTVKKGK